MVPLLWSMLPLCTTDNGTSATENGASGCHKKLHSCCKLCLLLLTFIPSPFAAVNSTTIVVVDSSFSSCLWQLKMLLWWLSCFKWFMFFPWCCDLFRIRIQKTNTNIRVFFWKKHEYPNMKWIRILSLTRHLSSYYSLESSST